MEAEELRLRRQSLANASELGNPVTASKVKAYDAEVDKIKGNIDRRRKIDNETAKLRQQQSRSPLDKK